MKSIDMTYPAGHPVAIANVPAPVRVWCARIGRSYTVEFHAIVCGPGPAPTCVDVHA